MKIALAIFILICGILVGHHTTNSETAAAVQIINLDNHSFYVDSKTVEKILGNKRIRDRHIVIFSIVGALRNGKSFFLNFPLKYLHARVTTYFKI